MEKDLITTNLTNLFGIRAGLSMISQHTEEIRKNDAKIYAINQEADTMRQKIYRIESDIQNLNNTRQQLVIEAQNCKQHAEKCLSDSQKPHRSTRSDLKPNSVLGFIIGAILFLLIASFILWLEQFIDITLLIWSSFVLTPIIYIFGIKRYLVYRLSFKEGHKELINSYHANLNRCATLELKIKNMDSEIDRHIKQLNSQEAILEGFTKENNKAIVYPCRNNITILSKRSKLIAKAINDTYGGFITEADYGNIDLLIHYFETGRADDMKEALQLVDRQRQTDQIVHAIRAAQQAISSHIESAFSRMGMALAESFSRLDARLETISSELAESRMVSSRENQELARKLSEQVSATEISNALLAKSNATNQQLIDDLRYNQRFWVK